MLIYNFVNEVLTNHQFTTHLWHPRTLTRHCLHPATYFVHGRGAEEEEETEAANAGDDQHHGHSNEEGGGLERTRGDSGELSEATLAGQLSGDSVSDAIVKKAEVAGLRRIHAIADPIGLWENGHINNTEQDSEDGPQKSNDTRVADVIGLV